MGLAGFTFTDTVTLTVVGPATDPGRLQRRYVERGVRSAARGCRVRAGEGPEAFMEALVEPRQSSYLVDPDDSGACGQ